MDKNTYNTIYDSCEIFALLFLAWAHMYIYSKLTFCVFKNSMDFITAIYMTIPWYGVSWKLCTILYVYVCGVHAHLYVCSCICAFASR